MRGKKDDPTFENVIEHLHSHTLPRVFQDNKGVRFHVDGVVLSCTGEQFIVFGGVYIACYRLQFCANVFMLKAEAKVNDVVILPDGKTFAAVAENGVYYHQFDEVEQYQTYKNGFPVCQEICPRLEIPLCQKLHVISYKSDPLECVLLLEFNAALQQLKIVARQKRMSFLPGTSHRLSRLRENFIIRSVGGMVLVYNKAADQISLLDTSDAKLVLVATRRGPFRFHDIFQCHHDSMRFIVQDTDNHLLQVELEIEQNGETGEYTSKEFAIFRIYRAYAGVTAPHGLLIKCSDTQPVMTQKRVLDCYFDKKGCCGQICQDAIANVYQFGDQLLYKSKLNLTSRRNFRCAHIVQAADGRTVSVSIMLNSHIYVFRHREEQVLELYSMNLTIIAKNIKYKEREDEYDLTPGFPGRRMVDMASYNCKCLNGRVARIKDNVKYLTESTSDSEDDDSTSCGADEEDHRPAPGGDPGDNESR